MSIRKLHIIFLTGLFILLLSSCTKENIPISASTDTPTIVAATETATVVPTETPMPSRVVLLAPSNVPGDLVNQFQTHLASIVDNEGMTLDVRGSINEEDITPDWKIVLLLQTPENLEQLRTAAPGVQFVIFSDDPAIQGEGNLSTIFQSTLEQAFMAGYVTILSAPDFRAGGLVIWDEPEIGAQQQEAFKNGAAYYCGRCASVYMPVSLFPVTIALPSSSTPTAWMDAFSALNNEYIIYTIYVDDRAGSTELYNNLIAMNVVLVGAQKPADAIGVRWAATVVSDPIAALESIWGELLNGVGGHSVKAPIEVRDVDEQFLSSGRLRLVEETLQMVMEGAILPLSPEYP